MSVIYWNLFLNSLFWIFNLFGLCPHNILCSALLRLPHRNASPIYSIINSRRSDAAETNFCREATYWIWFFISNSNYYEWTRRDFPTSLIKIKPVLWTRSLCLSMKHLLRARAALCGWATGPMIMFLHYQFLFDNIFDYKKIKKWKKYSKIKNKGGDPAAGSPTATLWRLNPPRWA